MLCKHCEDGKLIDKFGYHYQAGAKGSVMCADVTKRFDKILETMQADIASAIEIFRDLGNDLISESKKEPNDE